MSPRFLFRPRPLGRLRMPLVAALLGALALTACRPTPPAPRPVRSQATQETGRLTPRAIGERAPTLPWMAQVTAVDLDQDGRLDVLACDAQLNRLVWLRQGEGGAFEERVLPHELQGLVHAEPVDLDGDGDLDVVVACMGYVFPNNDRIGSVVALENVGGGHFREHLLIDRVARVNDVRAADLNGDGRLDLALAQFGFDQGEVRWLEQTGPWEFRSHVLLELSGAINIVAADFTGDGRIDLAVQISQQWEEIYLFENRGGGEFGRKRVWGSTNEDYGSSGMALADLNRDGRPDLVFSNGDGFGPAAVPGPRPWHGVQWLENTGQGLFRYHAIGHLDGAYSPLPVDLDGDGALDVVAVSAFIEKDGQGRPAPALAWFRNDGSQRFEKRILAYAPRHQITVCAGDFDGSGAASLVTGGFYVIKPEGEMSRLTLWEKARR